ncbi:MAG: lipid A biosynthesis lauroyl acyltransferase [Rhodobacteraceae bacterium HLUCCA12]|nr:MAG: lipid A biosynthesis lauroyl acyltransferase [Rhodobacteraceae bacterium HLUCCA12]
MTPPDTPSSDRPPQPRGTGTDAGPRGLRERATLAGLHALTALPYRWRLGLAAWAGRRVLARRGRLRRRIRAGVLHLFPHLPDDEVARICDTVPENIARSTIEIISGPDFYAHAAQSPIAGPGWPALQEARKAGRPVLLLTAHFGNSAAVGAALRAQGFDVGTFYTPMPGAAVNRFYAKAVEAVTSPLFPAGRQGVLSMVRHLRRGGMLAISVDLDRPHGVMLDFLGKPARTVLSIAEMGLKHDALMVPVYGIRRPDGVHFDAFIDDPIAHSEPVAMTQAINDGLGRMVARHKDQWLWWHKRWKDDHPADAPSPQEPAP